MTKTPEHLQQPIPSDLKRGWRITTVSESGRARTIQPAKIQAHQERLGVDIEYGFNGSFDGFKIHEQGGGGSVLVPYTIISGEIYIGVIRQFRDTTNKYVTELPRGFLRVGETHTLAALRELSEETGAKESVGQTIKEFKGKPVNPNSAFFVANSAQGEGVKFFPVEVASSKLFLRRPSNDPTKQVYQLQPYLKGKITAINEKIQPEGLRFMHIDLVNETEDGFTQIGSSKLQSYLRRMAREVPSIPEDAEIANEVNLIISAHQSVR